jgi:hypothetical protein
MTTTPWTRALAAFALATTASACAPGEVPPEDAPDVSQRADASSGSDASAPRDTGAPAQDADAKDAASSEDAPTDADPPDAHDAAEDAGAVPDGLVPVFIAQGHVGRTTISCDDGRTWVADRAFDSEGHALVCGKPQAVQCYDTACDFVNNGACDARDPCDCDHHPGAGRGVTWGDGWFVTTWGWGPRGGLMRSQDGISWEMVHEDTTFAGVVYGNGRFVTGGRRPLVSDDQGATWANLGEADLRSPAGETVHNPRSLGFADGVFVLTGSSGDKSDLLVSADGETWTRPDPLPAACTSGIRGAGAVGGGGTIVLVTGDGGACASTDQGASFQHVADAGSFDTGVVHDGAVFLAWGDGSRWSSADGLTWTATPLAANTRLGHVARHPDTGTLVASNGGWKQWYDKQRFYRSTDGGITWDELPATAFNGSHPIRAMGFGWAPASDTCPAPEGQ